MRKGFERRLYYRLNIEEFEIEPIVIPGDFKPYTGKVRDVSSGGLSFYTKEKSLIFDNDKIVDVVFNIGDTSFIVKMEIIREEKVEARTLHAGAFVGISAPLKDRLFKTLEAIAKREPVLV